MTDREETPDRDPPPRPLMGPVFWALMALSAVCVAAGAAVALFGPQLLGPG